jgi:hypothetical protein
VPFQVADAASWLQPHEKRLQSTEVLDNVESVNIPKFIPENSHEPFHPFFDSYKDEIEAFSRVCPTSSALERPFLELTFPRKPWM